jgi:hypothetical protein
MLTDEMKIMEETFTGYLIPRSSLPFPDQVMINDTTVIHKRFQVFGVKKKFFQRQHIISISLDKGLMFCNIIIHTFSDSIAAKGFTNSQGEKIKNLLGF